ncbi:glutathione S-transferase family protein [Stenomitos frigidus]|uniref:Glutathione S-transferase n=1 Tax=Stenomitos frigidus ULC18 TaxID=2107698 RepID=A0A2T1E1X3_9CYAN|nr:glutathione S-transferase family protein [Stenomitos frigidus]PSB26732.1 glutathione S-transferase [Stenomitos frigidus ULC18]
MLKLYGGKFSRASIVQWCLEELTIPYEYVLLDMQAGEHLEADYTAINPIGKVPAIVDGDFKLWESGAILLYLADKYGKSETAEQRAELAQWILFANATLGPELLNEATRDHATVRLLKPINQILELQPYLLGEQFSPADVAIGSTLGFFQMRFQMDFSAFPAVIEYLKQLSARPAFQKTIGGRSA